MKQKYLRYALIGVLVVLAGISFLNKAKNGDAANTVAQAVSQASQAAQEQSASIAEREAAAVAAVSEAVTPVITEAKNALSESVTETTAQVANGASQVAATVAQTANAARISETGEYNSKDEVALYIYTFDHLPSNYITKKQAQALGWSGGGLDSYAPGKSIGGDRFGNNEGRLAKAKGRTYTECDIDTRGKKSRGAKRIVFSNDGLIYYTGDHYEHFDLLYDKTAR